MKKTFHSILCFTLILIASASVQAQDYKKWSLGASASYRNIWAANLDFFDFEEQTNDFDSIQGLGVDAHISYHFSPRTRMRLTGGIARLYNVDIGNRSWWVNAELAGIFHFVKEPKLFDPYIGVGIGVPKIIHGIVGNEFHLTDRFSVFTEVNAATIVLVSEVDVRAGLSWHF